MKQIVADYLRRWRWDYVFGMLFVGLIDVMWTSYGQHASGSFMFVCIFMLPPLADWKRGHRELVMALPVSRSTTALFYWGIVNILPVLLIAGTFIAAGIVSACFFAIPPLAILLKSFAVAVLASLIWAGASGCILTFFSPTAPEHVNYFAASWMLLWFPALFLTFSQMLDLPKQSPVVYLAAGLLGILLAGWSFMRSEKLVFARARTRAVAGHPRTQAPKRIPSPRPGLPRFGGYAFGFVLSGFVSGLIASIFFLIIGVRINEDSSVCPYVFTFGGFGSMARFCNGMRFLRSLPLSAGRLALTLLFMPLFSILAIIAGLALMQWIKPNLSSIHYAASLMIPLAGAVCIASSLIVRFGRNGRLIAMLISLLASEVICHAVSDVKWPPVFWWLLGLGLIAAAFFLNQHWLRASASYRPSTTGESNL